VNAKLTFLPILLGCERNAAGRCCPTSKETQEQHEEQDMEADGHPKYLALRRCVGVWIIWRKRAGSQLKRSVDLRVYTVDDEDDVGVRDNKAHEQRRPSTRPPRVARLSTAWLLWVCQHGNCSAEGRKGSNARMLSA